MKLEDLVTVRDLAAKHLLLRKVVASTIDKVKLFVSGVELNLDSDEFLSVISDAIQEELDETEDKLRELGVEIPDYKELKPKKV